MGWNIETQAGGAGPGSVTIVEGSSFSVCAPSGDILPGNHLGVYFRDTRFVCSWLLLVDGSPLDPLHSATLEPFRAVFLGRPVNRGGRADSDFIVERERRVGTGLREEITLRNFSNEPLTVALELRVESDFADLFEVKAGVVSRQWSQQRREHAGQLLIESAWLGHRRGLTITAPGAEIVGGHLRYTAVVPARGRWTATVIATPTIDDEILTSGYPTEVPLHLTNAARRFQEWDRGSPVPVSSNEALTHTLNQSQEDLGSLRLFDPRHPQRQVVAAGVPWFMALFGRDSLLTSYMALSVDPMLALGTLQTLADYQGTKTRPATEEQPGRILHEVRLGVEGSLSLGGEGVYYGSIDATPLFVVVLAELRRWGVPLADIDALLPAADRALAWIDDHGDRDDDGFVEYERLNPKGLLNQGWKDSWDGVTFADGTPAEPPIALCEVQGYAYDAFRGRAGLAAELGDDAAARHWNARAEHLKKRFNEEFWLPDRGYYALALDHRKRPVDSCASNMGHCLWSGIVDADKAPAVAEHLLSPEMFSGWGVRTLATNMGAYNPVSYHNGSIWPHDNAIIVAGLMRYGFVAAAQRVAVGIMDAATHFAGRLPELFCGFDRHEYPQPVPYPTSCSPQAWASAAPVQIVRSLARFDPDVPNGILRVDPRLPEKFRSLMISNMPLAGTRVSMGLVGNIASVIGLPPGLSLVTNSPAGGSPDREA